MSLRCRSCLRSRTCSTPRWRPSAAVCHVAVSVSLRCGSCLRSRTCSTPRWRPSAAVCHVAVSVSLRCGSCLRSRTCSTPRWRPSAAVCHVAVCVPQVRIMFEVQDLQYATLATVSLCVPTWLSVSLRCGSCLRSRTCSTPRWRPSASVCHVAVSVSLRCGSCLRSRTCSTPRWRPSASVSHVAVCVPQVRIMFEVQDLQYATLATISRCVPRGCLCPSGADHV